MGVWSDYIHAHTRKKRAFLVKGAAAVAIASFASARHENDGPLILYWAMLKVGHHVRSCTLTIALTPRHFLS